MLAVHQSVAHPWQCDIMGHMTTRFYTAMFDDASYHFLFRLFGWNGARDAEQRLGWVDVRHTIEYARELHAGDLTEISAAVTKLGGKSMTVHYEMTAIGRDETVATLESVMVLFDLVERCAVTIPGSLRADVESHMKKAD